MKGLEDNFMLDGEDLKNLTDYDYIKKHLFFRLMSMDALQQSGLDAKIPYKQLGDIAITCSFTIKEDEHSRCSTFFVNEGLEKFGIDKEQLFDDTFKSSNNLMKYKMSSLRHLVEQTEETKTDYSLGIVITDKSCSHGAGAIMYGDFMERVSEKLEGDFFIIPSSIHELIAIPVSGDIDIDSMQKQLEHLEDSVCSCNATVCEPEDILSYNVYYYDHEEHCVCMAKDVIGSSEVYGKELRKSHHLMS